MEQRHEPDIHDDHDYYENEQYYYHPDHLGSSSYITDTKGKVYVHLEYFPFGETWAHEHYNTNTTPYKFTGKELDEETGLYYYGARYYDPRTSVWVSPDPILAKYMSGKPNGGVFNPANLKLFSYTYNNPVNFVDPDGNAGAPFMWRKPQIGSGKGGAVYSKGAGYTFIDAKGNINPAKSFRPAPTKTYQTYTKAAPDGGVPYHGKTSGTGTPKENVDARDGANHHMTKQGYGPAVLDKSSTNPNAIRGREQINIMNSGGSQSSGGTSANVRNGIGKNNPKKFTYLRAALKEFGKK